MAALSIVTWNETTKTQKRKVSSTTIFDFLSINIGADLLSLAQSGSGSSAKWDFGARVIGNASDPLISTDVATKNYVDLNAAALIQLTGPANISGTYNNSMWVSGAITMTNNVLIKGNLMIEKPVSGTTSIINSNSYTLEVEGNVYLMGTGGLATAINFKGADGTVSVAAKAGGTLIVHGTVTTTSSAADCTIVVSGGASTNSAYPAGGAGGSVTIYGDFYGNVTAAGGASVSSTVGGAGGTTYISGNFKTIGATSLNGGANAATGSGGHGGALTVGGCVFNSAGLALNGGTSAAATGGTGGTLTLGGILTGVGALTYTGGTGSINGSAGSVSYI